MPGRTSRLPTTVPWRYLPGRRSRRTLGDVVGIGRATRAVGLGAVACLLVAGLGGGVPTSAATRAAAAGNAPGALARGKASAAAPTPATEDRIAFAGTRHRSLARVELPDLGYPGEPVETQPPATSSTPWPGQQVPTPYDDEPAACGSTVTWVSLRDSVTPQVYLRTGDGPVRRVTNHAATDGHPVVSPDERSVAFDSDAGRTDGSRDIYVVPAAGGTPRRVTDGTGDNRWPTWSPDGTQLAFQGRRGSSVPQVYRIGLDGSAVTRLTEGAGAGQPAWDPDQGHGRIAYTRMPDTEGQWQIYVLYLSDGRDLPLLSSDWTSRKPSWSPDGVRLAFISNNRSAGLPAGTFDMVYTAVPADNACGCLAEPRLMEDRDVAYPVWYTPPGGRMSLLISRDTAPDPSTATLQDVRSDGSDPRDLGLVMLREDPAAMGNRRLLLNPETGNPWTVHPSYTPDGGGIVLNRFETAGPAARSRLATTGLDGTAPNEPPVADRQPTDSETGPAISPDGRWMAFSRTTADGGTQIVVVDAGTGALRVTVPRPDQSVPPGQAQTRVSDSQPTWSADGAVIAFTRVVLEPGQAWPESHVYTVDLADPDNQRNLTHALCGDTCQANDAAPAFAPVGRQLAMVRGQDGVLLVDLDTGGCRVVLGPQGSCTGQGTPIDWARQGPQDPPAWSPDARRLTVTTLRGDDRDQLSVVDLGTAAVRQLTPSMTGRQKQATWYRAVDVATSLVRAPGPAPVGTEQELLVSVTSKGPSPALTTSLKFTVPPGMRLTAMVPGTGRCDVPSASCDLGPLAVGATTQITVRLLGLEPGRPTLTWAVTGGLRDPVPADNTGTVTLTVDPAPVQAPPRPLVSVGVAPDPGYVGGSTTVTYTVRNVGGQPATGLRLRPAMPAGVTPSLPAGCDQSGCALADLAPGTTATLVVPVGLPTALQGTVTGTVVMGGSDVDTATAGLLVLQPKIVATPTVGPTGFVTLIRGTDFPPGVPVRLRWNIGVTVAANSTLPDANGAFIAQMLVIDHALYGPRLAVASGSGFAEVSTPYRVVLGPLQPPGLLQRRY